MRFQFFEKVRSGEIRDTIKSQIANKEWSDEQNDEGVKVDCSTRPVQSKIMIC